MPPQLGENAAKSYLILWEQYIIGTTLAIIQFSWNKLRWILEKWETSKSEESYKWCCRLIVLLLGSDCVLLVPLALVILLSAVTRVLELWALWCQDNATGYSLRGWSILWGFELILGVSSVNGSLAENERGGWFFLAAVCWRESFAFPFFAWVLPCFSVHSSAWVWP